MRVFERRLFCYHTMPADHAAQQQSGGGAGAQQQGQVAQQQGNQGQQSQTQQQQTPQGQPFQHQPVQGQTQAVNVQGQQGAGGQQGQQQQGATQQAGQQQQQTGTQVPADLADYLSKLGQDPTKMSADALAVAGTMFEAHKQRMNTVNAEAKAAREKAQKANDEATKKVLEGLFGKSDVTEDEKKTILDLAGRSQGMLQTVDLLQMAGVLDERTANVLRHADPNQTAQAMQVIQTLGFLPQGQVQQQPFAGNFPAMQQPQQQQAQNPVLAMLMGGQQQQVPQQQQQFLQQAQQGQLAGQLQQVVGQQLQQQGVANGSVDVNQLAQAIAQRLIGGAGVGADLGNNGQGTANGSQVPGGQNLFEMYGQTRSGNPETAKMFGQVQRVPVGQPPPQTK